MAATWIWTVLVALIYFLPNRLYTIAVRSEPLVITISKDGVDSEACLSGSIRCKTYGYVSWSLTRGYVSNVTLVITSPQEVSGPSKNFNVSSLKLIGQGDDFTFICHDSNSYLSIEGNSFDFPKRVSFENVRMLCIPPLTIMTVKDVELKGYIGQGISVIGAFTGLSIENSTLSNIFGDSVLINIDSTYKMTIKDSSVIHNDEKGRPLSISFIWDATYGFLIENTSFTLTRANVYSDQPPIAQINPRSNRLDNASINFTISNCQFFNYTSTIVLVKLNNLINLPSDISIKDAYLNILNSNFTVPDLLILRRSSVEVAYGWPGRNAKVYTRLEGNRVHVRRQNDKMATD